METERICPSCHKPLPPDVPMGLCPECLIKAGFNTGTEPGSAEGKFIPPPVEEVAKLFPQLEIIGFIGKGGMGAVYKARQPALDRFVALKILPPRVARDPGFAERFNREARALARLNHPNIVAVHDFGQSGGLHYLVMELVDGANLREVERSGRLAPEQALAIVPQICEALQFAHNEGIVHRDIKPENILIDKRGRVKITDFGIAKILGATTGTVALTGAKDVVGTPHYMAPEQIEKPTVVDHRADIYSLGVVFYEMLTGELPLGKFAPPSRKVQVDVRLDEVVLRALEKEPEHRYQQVSQVKTEVETIAGTAPPAVGFAPRPGAAPPPIPVPARAATSNKTLLPTFLLAFFFGVFGAHRFYVGKTGTALLQLFTFGACGIWATIDWILILCKAFTDDQGRRITEWFHPQNGELKADVGKKTAPPIKGVQAQVKGPAIGLLVTGMLNWVLIPLVMLILGPIPIISRMPGADGIPKLVVVGMALLPLLLCSFIIYAALKMMQLERRGLVMVASVLAMLITPGNLIGLPMGIWSLVVLNRREVREAFALNPRSGWSAATAAWALALATVLALVLIGPCVLGPVAHSQPSFLVTGRVTDAVTGEPIARARVDDNRYGASPRKAPQQAWTDTNGFYQLKTWHEEHTLAVSAPGYETKLEVLLTKPFGRERAARMDFQLQPRVAERSQSGRDSELTFGPGTETVLKDMAPSQEQRVAELLDLDTGSRAASTNFGANDRETHAWIREHKLDVLGVVERGQIAVLCMDMAVVPAASNGWDAATAPEIVTNWGLNQQEPKPIIAISPVTDNTDAWFFHTREGSQGIIQILGREDNPPGVRIRYRLVQGNGPNAMAAPERAIVGTLGEPYEHPVGGGGFRSRSEMRQDFDQTLPLASDGRVSLDNVNGRIEITGWDRDEVVIKAVKRGKTREGVNAVRIEVESRHGHIAVQTRQPADNFWSWWTWFWERKDNVSVDYSIQVPRRARLEKIESVNGRIEIAGVAGDIEANTVNGEVQTKDAAGNQKLGTVNGRIAAELASLCGDQSVSLNTVNGSIVATLPASASAKVSAATVNGGITSEFPSLKVEKDFPLGSHLKGTLGEGGARFKANTVNGSISFRRGRDEPAPALVEAPASEAGPAATSAALAWLTLIDEGRYVESWKAAAAFFQGAVAENAWTNSLLSVRQPLGPLVSRKLKTAQEAASLPGAPDGQYVVLEFDASFANKKSALETVTFVLEKDGKWRAAGYFIR